MSIVVEDTIVEVTLEGDREGAFVRLLLLSGTFRFRNIASIYPPPIVYEALVLPQWAQHYI